MKNNFLLTVFFLCFVVGLRAQLHEIQTSYHAFNSYEFSDGFSVSYYRNFSQRSAIGIRTNFRGLFDQEMFSSKAGSLDLVNRWNISNSKRFRLLAELGASYLRRYDDPILMGFCGTGLMNEPAILPSHHHGFDEDEKIKSNYFGLVGSVGFDLLLGKHLIAGMDFAAAYYHTQSSNYYYPELGIANVRFRVGTRF